MRGSKLRAAADSHADRSLDLDAAFDEFLISFDEDGRICVLFRVDRRRSRGARNSHGAL